MTQAEKKAEVELRVTRALARIQRAQAELALAQSELSNFLHAMPEFRRAGKLYEHVHSFWYRVRSRANRYELDSAVEAAHDLTK